MCQAILETIVQNLEAMLRWKERMYSTELSSNCTCELPEFPYPSLWAVSQCIRVGKATSAGEANTAIPWSLSGVAASSFSVF